MKLNGFHGSRRGKDDNKFILIFQRRLPSFATYWQ